MKSLRIGRLLPALLISLAMLAAPTGCSPAAEEPPIQLGKPFLGWGPVEEIPYGNKYRDRDLFGSTHAYEAARDRLGEPFSENELVFLTETEGLAVIEQAFEKALGPNWTRVSNLPSDPSHLSWAIAYENGPRFIFAHGQFRGEPNGFPYAMATVYANVPLAAPQAAIPAALDGSYPAD
ncbi:MAG: hypothetical protein AAGJ50_12345 [Pseudomonadota bacterium]